MHATIRIEGKSGHITSPKEALNPIPTLLILLQCFKGQFGDALQIINIDTRNHANSVIPGSVTTNIYVDRSFGEDEQVRRKSWNPEVSLNVNIDSLIKGMIDGVVDQCQTSFEGKVLLTYN